MEWRISYRAKVNFRPLFYQILVRKLFRCLKMVNEKSQVELAEWKTKQNQNTKLSSMMINK